MFSKKIKITCFNLRKKNSQKKKKLFAEILQKKNSGYQVIETFSKNYQYSYSKKKIAKFKKYKSISIFGLGGFCRPDNLFNTPVFRALTSFQNLG